MTTTTVTGAPAWIDLMTSDLDAAKSFYGQLFGWDFADGGEEFGHYQTITLDGRPVGGAMSSVGLTCPAGDPMPTNWSVYLSSNDAQATTEKVTAHGGQVLVEPMPVGDLGQMAVFLAPSGACIGTWQRGSFDGFELTLAPGTPCWFETLTTDYAADREFYQEAFGWDLHNMDDSDGRYATHGKDDDAVAGICDAKDFMAPGYPPHWRTYFRVEDTDRAIERIKELGGSVLDGPMDSPFGRLATVTDPQGASFQIIQAPQKAA